MSKKIFVIISMILTLALAFHISSFSANAEKVAEVVTQTTANSKSVNISQISTGFVTLGYSVTLNAMSKGLDEKKCQYGVNFQMFKLDLEKAEEPEIKLPTSAGS